MATLTITREAIVVERHERTNPWEKIGKFFSALTEYVEPIFVMMPLDHFDKKARANMNEREKSIVDAHFHSM